MLGASLALTRRPRRRQAPFTPQSLNPLVMYAVRNPATGFIERAVETTPAQEGDPVGTLRNVAAGQYHLRAFNDATRPQFQTAGAPHIASDGLGDTLRTDVAVGGTFTLWMAGDFSGMTGSSRYASLGGDGGKDWSAAGYCAFEHGSGVLSVTRAGGFGKQPITTGYPPYILVELNNYGHRSYGPMGRDYTNVASNPVNASRLALFAAADDDPREYGVVKMTEFGIIPRALTETERAQMLAYLDNLEAPA